MSQGEPARKGWPPEARRAGRNLAAMEGVRCRSYCPASRCAPRTIAFAVLALAVNRDSEGNLQSTRPMGAWQANGPYRYCTARAGPTIGATFLMISHRGIGLHGALGSRNMKLPKTRSR